MPRKEFIIASFLFLIASCTQDLAKIEIHNYKKSDSDITKVTKNRPQKEGNYIYVEYGETIYSIAIKHNISYLDLANINNLEWPYSLETGQKLYLVKPDQELQITQNKINNKTIEDTSQAEEPKSTKPQNRITIEQPEETSPAEEPKSTQPQNRIAIEQPATNFKWPINGKVISYFGINSNGTKNDGIYIETQLNQPVKAADSGKVIYAGQDLEQYGNLLIISHKDQYFSAYAHLSELKVTKGTIIQVGQIIGLTGDTGNISSPQLYFSLRKNKTPIDPLKYLPRVFSYD